MATSNTAIKITSLPNIGNNIAPTTLIPVVNMSGVPTTQKANLQIAGNLILAGAGTANFVPAAVANLAYTVVNSNQSNITRVGTLNINTFKVSGGTNGQYIQTDGAGNLSWVTGGGSGNGVVGGSNGQIQFNNAGNFAGSTNLFWDDANARLATVNFASDSATIYGDLAAININASANVRPNAIYTNHYFYSNGVPFTGGTGISGITVKDEGTNVVASANTINFVGAGVTASNVSGVATITINGGGGNANTANVTFNDFIVQGKVGYGLGLAPTADDAANLKYMQVRVGDTDSHIHFDTGNNLAYDQFFGDDSKYVQVSSIGNIIINSHQDGGPTAQWTFDYSGNLTAPGNIIIDNGVDGNITSSGNVNIISNNNTWMFNTDGVLTVPGTSTASIEGAPDFNVRIRAIGDASAKLEHYNGSSTTSAIAANASDVTVDIGSNTWTFSGDGNLSAPGSGYFAGTNLFVGPGSDVFPNLGGSTLVISSTDSAYVQAAIVNVSDNGSADWTAYGHRGYDAGGWIDMGFNSSGYNDPNYTITGQGDGAITVQSYFDGQSPGGRGGNLILATGENGTTNDIVFATNGFLLENEFGRISSANNELQFTSGGNFSGANVISANSFAGNGANITNVPISWTTAPSANDSAGTAGQAAYDSGGNLFICVATDTWTKITGTTSW